MLQRNLSDEDQSFVYEDQSSILYSATIKNWISQQRQTYKSGKMTEERKNLLQKLPGWVWDGKEEIEGDAHWDRYVSALRDFQLTNGHCYVRNEFHTNDGLSLGTWVSFRRGQYKKNSLSTDRIRILESIPGWIWIADSKAKIAAGVDFQSDTNWDRRFQLLKDLIDTQGHTNIPINLQVGNENLGMWVRRQRQNKSDGKLRSDREVRLNDLPGWSWVNSDPSWDRNFQLLENYVELFGHARVPDNYKINELALGKWVGKQRQKFKNGDLSKERIEELESLPGWTWNAKLSRTKVVPNADLTQ